MKTLSGTLSFKYIVSIAVVVMALVPVGAFAQGRSERPVPADRKLTLKLKDAELKDQTGAAFKKAVQALKGDQFSVRLKKEDGSVEEVTPAAGASIKIDKVTKSALAQSLEGDKFTPIGARATQSITSDSSTEIQAVLSTLK